MQEPLNTEHLGATPEAAVVMANDVNEARREVEIRAEVLHHPDHEPRHFRVKLDATLLRCSTRQPTSST
jgi:hypothetical protein